MSKVVGQRRRIIFSLHSIDRAVKLLFSCFVSLALTLQPFAAGAQVTADPNAGANSRPTIGAAPNGVPLIDIATPNGRGLSHNKYHDFNVANPGVILNNLDSAVGISQLGGVIAGNPNLAHSGAANVILNEVTSSRRSALEGPTEVSGRGADVIIANPNGITCNGCGFINTPRATLTTGIPQIGLDGSLNGFDVRGGDVTFGANGANLYSGKGAVDIFDVVSRSVRINGPVAGHDIGITAGTGKFDYASREMKELLDSAGKPEYAIDGSALGALQADRIKIVATEKGVGVRMRGDMAANAGQLTLSANGKLSLKNVSGRDGVAVKADGNKIVAKKITSKKTVTIKADEGVTLETIGADGDVMVDAGHGLLSIDGDAISARNVTLNTDGRIEARQLVSGGAMNVRAGNGIDVLMAITDEHASLRADKGDVNAMQGIRSGGELTIVADKGAINAATLISFNNMALDAGQDLNITGTILAHGNLTVNSDGARFDTALIGKTAVFNIDYLAGNNLVAGIDFAASQSSAGGSIILNHQGNIAINATDETRIDRMVSSGDIDIVAENDISYDDLRAFGEVNLNSKQGGISFDHSTVAAGDITLTAQTLDLSDNRFAIETAQTLSLNGDNINVSGSTLSYGGIHLNSKAALDMHNATLAALTNTGGSGDISIAVGKLTTDETTSILAANDLLIAASHIDNNGQLAAAHDLSLKVQGDLKNRQNGLLYAGADGYVYTAGIVLNDYGAILAGQDLYFADYQGSGKSAALTNHAGLIQAGGDLSIRTNVLTNEANSVPTLFKTHAATGYAFALPKNYAMLGMHNGGYANTLVYDANYGTYGAGKEEKGKRRYGVVGPRKIKYRVGTALYNSKEDAYSTVTLPDGSIYKADNWIYRDQKHGGRITRWDLNRATSMALNTDTEYFLKAPTVTGLIQSGNDMNIDANLINNRYSDIEAGGDITILADKIYNEGLTRNRYDYITCHASSTCFGYNLDGTRNSSRDIARGQAGAVKVTAVETLSSTVRAGGSLNISAAHLDNKAADGSMSGAARFEANISTGNPLDALAGMTAGGALFAPSVDFNTGNYGTPKPQSGGFGGTLPNQHFIYETRAQFLDVGKFYGSAYFIDRIGYQPDRAILFLGDAYFENQLIDRQLRDMIGQGLGKGSFLPGDDAIEQMKQLLDNGIAYAQENGILFGEPLSIEQAANLDRSIVIYVRQTINGEAVYAPVVYVAAGDKQSLSPVAGATIQGHHVNIGVDNLANSGLIASNSNLKIEGLNIVADGGAFSAKGDAQLASAGNLTLNAGVTSLNGNAAILPTRAVDAGGTAIMQAQGDARLNGVEVKAGDDLGIFAKNVAIGAQKTSTANGSDVIVGADLTAANDLQIKARDDITVTGSSIETGNRLTMSAQYGDLTIQAAAANRDKGDTKTTTQQKAEVSSSGSMMLTADKNLTIIGSDVNTGEDLSIDAGENVTILAVQDKSNSQYGRLNMTTITQQGSTITAGQDISVKAEGSLLIGTSHLDAGGNIGLGAHADITITALTNQYEAHVADKNYTMNQQETVWSGSSITAGGAVTAIAGLNGGSHDLNIIASHIGASDSINLTASSDVNILSADNSHHKDVKQQSKGGLFRSAKKSETSVNQTTVSRSSIIGDAGVNIHSGTTTTIAASDIITGTDDHDAHLNISAGGNIIISSAAESLATSSSSSKKNLLGKSSSRNSTYDEDTISSNLLASGNINLNAGEHVVVGGSNIVAGADVTIAGESVSIIGAQENHAASSYRQKSGLGVGSGGGFYSIWGKKSRDKKSEATINIGSTISAGSDVNITATQTDINIIGSQIAAQNDIDLEAIRDINITPGQENQQASESQKRSGIGVQLSRSNTGASIGFGYGSAKDQTREGHSLNTQSILTAGNDVTMQAGRDINLMAADVAAGRDVNIHAENDVNLLAAHDVSNYEEMHERLFAGVTLSVQSGLLTSAQDVQSSLNHLGKAGTDGIGIANTAAGLITGANAYGAIKDNMGSIKALAGQGGGAMSAKDILKQGNLISGSITVGFNHSKTASAATISTPVVTTIEGGRSITLEAERGDINGVGVQISAGTNKIWNLAGDDRAGDINLTAGQDINLVSAEASQNVQGSSSSSGLSVGVDLAGKPAGNGQYGQGRSHTDDVTHLNSNIMGTGAVTLKAGDDVNLKGAVVSGNSVNVGAGGDLNIASQQDTENYRSKSGGVHAGFEEKGFSSGWQNAQSSSDYASVAEQSGIRAGDGGFDIKVGGNTDLQGAIISSTAEADKNRLETATLTISDIENHAEAKAATNGLILPTGALTQGKYGLAKTAVSYLLSKGDAEISAQGQTKSAISNGTIIITDKSGQLALTGADAAQTIAMLNRDTENTHDPVGRLDVGPLKKRLEEEQALKQFLFQEGLKYADDAYITMFVKEHPVLVIERDENGDIQFIKDAYGNDTHIPLYRELTDEEKLHMQAGADGQVKLSINGIFNDRDAAASYAVQHVGAHNSTDPIYFISFPKADAVLGELLVAGYQKLMENSFWGMTNSGKEIVNLTTIYGQDGLHLYGHSRGAMTIGNALRSLDGRGNEGMLSNTDISLYGPAFNAQNAANMLKRLSGGSKTSVELQNHEKDFVGSWPLILGGNPASNFKIPEGSNWFKEMINMFKNSATVHSCYGYGRPGCENKYDSPSKSIWIKAKE